MLTPHLANAQYAWELIKQPAFRSAYQNILGEKANEKWLSKLPGPSTQGLTVTINGVEYLLVNSCRQHACNVDNIVIAYSAVTNRVFGKLVQNQSVKWLGNPPPEIQAELEVYYVKQFKKK